MYGSYEEALLDRVEFLRDNPRYAKAGLFDEGTRGNLEKEAAALQRAGYATDPHYAEGLVRVFNSPTMQHAINQAQTLATTRDHAPDIRPRSGVSHQQACLAEGARGSAVAALQAELSQLGYSGDHGHPLKADGDFGIRTRHAVERFQHDHHLTVDGKVGPRTRQAIHSALQQCASPPSLTDVHHPDHALFAQALAGVRAPDAHGQPTEQQRLNLAAAMVVEARLQGLTRIDQVVLGDDGSRVYIAQHPTSFMEQTKIGSVDTVAALQTPVARSSGLAASPRSSSAASLAPIIQPPAPTQTMVV
jgi:hypothetical protein